MQLLVVLVAGVALSGEAGAHFKMLEPAPWVVTNERGDPQKVGPCGGDPKGRTSKILSKAVTKVTGGSKLHLKIQETIYHSGHYRVALAVNSRTELPPDPVCGREVDRDGGVYSVWGRSRARRRSRCSPTACSSTIRKPGEPASARPKTPMAPWETDIQLPNINCAKCTLQVIQFMADHGYNQPGGYAYHHCADLQITADPAKPIDKGWPAATTSK